MAIGVWGSGSGPTGAYVTVNEDGTVAVTTGMVDISGSNTAFAQIVAEELSVPFESVVVTTADTDIAPFGAPSAGSKVTYSAGAAVQRAAQDAKKRIFEVASQALGVEMEKLELRDGSLCADGDSRLALAEVATAALSAGGPIVGKATLSRQPPAPVVCVQIVEVEVDPETLMAQLKRIVAAQDCGQAINPAEVEGQVEGGVLQSAGFGLWEEYVYSNGKLRNPNLLDYHIATSLDAPRIEVHLVQQPSKAGPFGAKGVGEVPVAATAAAIANAIEDALGVRVKHLPITPERIWQEMQGKEGEGRGRKRKEEEGRGE